MALQAFYNYRDFRCVGFRGCFCLPYFKKECCLHDIIVNMTAEDDLKSETLSAEIG